MYKRRQTADKKWHFINMFQVPGDALSNMQSYIFFQRGKYVITLSGGQALRSGSDYSPESQEAGIRSRL